MEQKLGMRNKYRKSTTLRCSAWSRCSLPVALWIMVGCLLLLLLYSLLPQWDSFSLETQLQVSKHLHELEQAEEEIIQMPPPRKRSPRAEKRKPKKETTIIDEFLDESSQLRHIFFPDIKTAVDPNKVNESFYYYPGRIWLDTEGNPIQAHGGGILYDELSRTYYWYGEYKDGPTYIANENGLARAEQEASVLSGGLQKSFMSIQTHESCLMI